MRRLKFAWLWALPVIFLSGCWDKLELEEQAYVVVLGLDLAKGNLVNVTFQIANPQVGSTDKGQAPNEPPSDTVTFAAPDIVSAKELANSVVSRKLSFAHLRTFIIGENLARTDLFHHVIGTSLRDPELRREINLIVSREKAADFIHRNKPDMETRPHKYYTFMQQRWKDTGHVPYSTLNRYFQRVSGELFLGIYATTKKDARKVLANEDDYLPGEVPQRSGDPVQLIGSAVFKNGRMIGTMTGEETRYALELRRKALSHAVVTSFPDPLNDKYRVSLRLVRNGNAKIDVNVKQDPPVVNVKVSLLAQVLSIPSLVDYARDLDKQKQLKEAVQNDMETRSKRLIQKTQRQFKADPFIWHVEARRKFWTMQQFVAYDWENKYKNAKVNVQYDITLEMFGKQLDPPKPESGGRGH